MPSGTFCNSDNLLNRFCISWSSKLNAQDGYSDVDVEVYIEDPTSYLNGYYSASLTIDGNSESFNGNILISLSTSVVTLKKKSVKVYHDNDGCKLCRIQSEYSHSSYYFTLDQTVDLECIDISPPNLYLNITNIQATSFHIEGLSLNDNCIEWAYTIDGGDTWKQFLDTSGISTSIEITDLVENTEYIVGVKAKKESNGIMGYSNYHNITTTKELSSPTILLNVTNIQPYNLTFKASSHDECDQWQYKIDTDEWTFFGGSSSNLSHTITNLADNTEHRFQVKARKVYNNIEGLSEIVNVRTPIETSPPTITFEITNIQQTAITINAKADVPCGSWKYSLNNNDYIEFGTSGITMNVTVNNLTANTQYKINIQATKIYNNVIGYSFSHTITTLAQPTNRWKKFIKPDVMNSIIIFIYYYSNSK